MAGGMKLQRYCSNLIDRELNNHPYFLRSVKNGAVDVADFLLRYKRFLESIPTKGTDFRDTYTAGLTEKQKEILLKRAGSEGRKMTLEGLGKEYDVEGERIRQIEAAAFRRMRHFAGTIDMLYMQEFAAFGSQQTDPGGFDMAYINSLTKRYGTASNLVDHNIGNIGLSWRLQRILQTNGIRVTEDLEMLNPGNLIEYGLPSKEMRQLLPYLYPHGQYIGDMGFSSKTLGLLEKRGIYSKDQLNKMTDDELTEIPNLGPATLREIRGKIREPPLPVNSLRRFGLSTRAMRALAAAGIRTRQDLEGKSDKELLRIRDLGARTLEEIREKTAS